MWIYIVAFDIKTPFKTVLIKKKENIFLYLSFVIIEQRFT